MDTQELILSGNYKKLSLGHHFILAKASERELAGLLSDISDEIEMRAYEFAGVNVEKIRTHIPQFSSLSDVCNHLKKIKSSELRKSLKEACVKDELLPAAESLYLSELLKKAEILFKPLPKHACKDEGINPEDTITFVGNAAGWFAIKKLSIDKATEDWEVAGILSSINQTAVSKSFDFSGLPVESEIIASAIKGKRRSFVCLGEALEGVKLGNPRTIMLVAEGVGYPLYLKADLLTNAYPGIKPPRVKGRKPKG